jgi:hypothetical protein
MVSPYFISFKSMVDGEYIYNYVPVYSGGKGE